MLRRSIPIMMAFTAVLSSCSLEQNGELTILGWTGDTCVLEDPYIRSLDFVGFDDCENMLYLRLQHSGRALSKSDGISIIVNDYAKLKDMSRDGPVRLEVGKDEIRISLYLNDDCPDFYSPMEASEGYVIFEEVVLKNGGHLSAIGEFNVVDTRTGGLLTDSAEFSMEAEISEEPPHTSYSVCPGK